MVASGFGGTFVFFIYGDIQWGNFSNIGFNPSELNFIADPNSESFMVPTALSEETVDIETTSNVGIPGFYAFRVDLPIIQGPEGTYPSVL